MRTNLSFVVQGQQKEALPSAAQLSAVYHSVNALLPRRGSTTSEQSMAHSSPAGSTHRGASQLLRLESRASDPFSNTTSSRQNSLTMPESALATSGQALSHSHSRVTRDSLPSHQSINHSPSESGIHEAHVMQSRGSSGVSGGSGSHSVKSSGGPPNLDRSSLSVLQVRERVFMRSCSWSRVCSCSTPDLGCVRVTACVHTCGCACADVRARVCMCGCACVGVRAWVCVRFTRNHKPESLSRQNMHLHPSSAMTSHGQSLVTH